MAEEHIKRRGFSFVNKELHYHYVGLMVVTVFVLSAIMSGFIFMSSFDTINILKQIAAGNRELFETLQANQISHLLRVLFALILIIIAVAVVGVMEMSKIAGPLYRIANISKKLAEGDYSMSFKLRTRDIPQDLGDSFGLMIDSLKGKAKKDAEKLDEATAKLESVSVQIKGGKADLKSAAAIDGAVLTLRDISAQKKKAIQPGV